MKGVKNNTVVILYNIRSAYNVGSIFRTADAAGVECIYCIGHTPTPIDRFGRKRKDIAKVALGAEDFVRWEYKESIDEVINLLKEQGYLTYCIEQSTESKEIKEIASKKNAFVFGSEVEGIPKEVIDICDGSIELPMKGKKESLNVSVCAGIVLYYNVLM